MYIAKGKSQSEKSMYYMTPTLCHIGKGKTLETAERLVIVRGLGVEGKDE